MIWSLFPLSWDQVLLIKGLANWFSCLSPRPYLDSSGSEGSTQSGMSPPTSGPAVSSPHPEMSPLACAVLWLCSGLGQYFSGLPALQVLRYSAQRLNTRQYTRFWTDDSLSNLRSTPSCLWDVVQPPAPLKTLFILLIWSIRIQELVLGLPGP